MARIKNLDRLLTSENINNSIIELDDFICERCAWGDNMDNLTPAQKTFYYNQNLEREVNNGGFDQYFLNSSGDFAHETIGALRTIGADHTAEILQCAIDLFPGKRVPRNREERISILEKIRPNASDEWAQLDEMFFAYKDNLNALNFEYVKRNQTEF